MMFENISFYKIIKAVFEVSRGMVERLKGAEGGKVRVFFRRKHKIGCEHSYSIPSAWDVISTELVLYDFNDNVAAKVAEDCYAPDHKGTWEITYDMLGETEWWQIERLLTPIGTERPVYSGDPRDDLPWRFTLRCKDTSLMFTERKFFSGGVSNRLKLQLRLECFRRVLADFRHRLAKKATGKL